MACAEHNINNYSMPVLQYDLSGNFIKRYPSASEAGRNTGFCQTHISSCCRGKVKTCHKYTFRYE